MGEKTEIVYDPKVILNYIKRKGSITSKDLEREFGYDRQVAILIISDLYNLSFITSGENDFEISEEDMKAYRVYRLTEHGENAKDSAQPKMVIMSHLAVFSELLSEIIDDLLEVSRTRGLGERELREMARERKLAILSNYSPEQLRELAREFQELKDLRRQSCQSKDGGISPLTIG